MSNLAAIDQYEEISIPNSISADKWHFNHDQAKNLGNLVVSGGNLVGLIGAFLLLRPLSAVLNEGMTIAVFLGLIVATLFITPKIAKVLISRRERTRDEYRAAHAGEIVDALKEQGWTVHARNPIEELISNNNPYFVNSDGVIYYTRQFYIGKEQIEFMMKLSDPVVQRKIENSAKQKQIIFMIKQYETLHGEMSPQKKAGFEAALNLTL